MEITKLKKPTSLIMYINLCVCLAPVFNALQALYWLVSKTDFIVRWQWLDYM